MAKVIKLDAVRPYRKSLERRFRKFCKGKLRVFGSRGDWSIGIDTGSKIVKLKSGFITQVTAILWGYRKFGVKAILHRTSKAA